MSRCALFRLLLLTAWLALVQSVTAQGTAFNYQGRLTQNGVPASGSWDLQFTLHDALTGGNQVGTTLTELAVPVEAGQFTVTLDFGAQFPGAGRWLELSAKPAGGPSYTTYSPRQPVTPTPYAIHAGTAGSAATAATAAALSGTVAASQLTGTVPLGQLPANVLTDGQSGVTLTGTFAGSGAGLTGVPGTLPHVEVAGTSVTTQPNTAYFLTGAATTAVTLPGTVNVGDVVQVFGMGAGGWTASPLDLGAPAGVVWTARESNRPWQSVASSADGTKLVAAVIGGQLYTSTDSGVTWTARESSRGWQSVASSADGTKLVAAEILGQLYTSTDSGQTWTARESSRAWTSVASSADGTKLVASVDKGQLYTSTDSGVTWTPRESNRGWWSVASSADGMKLVAATGGGQLYTSTDSGMTWTARESDRPWYSVASSADGTKLVAAVYGGRLYTSTDSGVTWTPRESDREWRCVASSADGAKLVAGIYFGNLFVSEPVPGATATGAAGVAGEFRHTGNGVWQQATLSQASANTPGTTVVRDTNGNFTAGTVTATAFVGDGAGLTGVPGTLPHVEVAVPSVTAQPDTAYFLTGAATTAVTLPGTASVGDVVQVFGVGAGGWTVSPLAPKIPAGAVWTARESNRDWQCVASSADGTKLVAGVGGGRLYTSTDSGVTWTARESSRDWYSVASSADGTKLVAAVFQGQLYTSTDSGVTWTARESSRFWRSVASSADGTKLIAASPLGRLYTSTDSGVTWTARESSRFWRSVASSADGTKLVAGAYGGNLFVSEEVPAATATGAAGLAGEFRYAGNGVWQPATLSQASGNTPGTAVVRDANGNFTAGTVTATAFVGDGSALTGIAVDSAKITDGTLVNADLSPTAAIADTKLATIATAGKVSDTALSANVTDAVADVNGATAVNTANTLVKRDAAGNVAAGTITAAEVVSTGNVTVGAFPVLKSSTLSPAAAATLTPTTGYVRLAPAAAVTLSATTAIAGGNTLGGGVGTLLILEGTSNANTVTVPNNANTRLAGAASRVLGNRDVLTLLWNGTDWVELSFADN